MTSAVFVLTDRMQVPAGRDLVEVGAELAAGMAGLTVVLREKDLDPPTRFALAEALAPSVHAAGGRLLLALDTRTADALAAATVPPPIDGVHLPADLEVGSFDHRFGGRGRPSSAIGGRMTVGRSCHSLDEVQAAAAQGCDHVFLSPVLATASKPGYGPVLGIDGLRRIIAALREAGVATPVVALGGVTPDVADTCLAAGADAVAAMGSAMAAPAGWVAWAAERTVDHNPSPEIQEVGS